MESILQKVNKQKKQRFEIAVKSAISYWQLRKERGYNEVYCNFQIDYFKALKY
ncbi:MAG: hypothetical protein ABF250_10330 [Polaribacter sp.]|uniref:hypothetical protein n=1 Tax=Polaribacter sp. TaxID=1920175 RepID=UPI00321C06F7